MLFLILDLVFSIVICSYFFPSLSSIVDTLYNSANATVIAQGGTISASTTWIWHGFAILAMFAVIFGSIWFIKNLISGNRNNQ